MSRAGSSIYVVALFVLWSLCATARAVDRHWNVPTGSWGIAGNWSPSGIPGAADVAYVDFFGGTPGAVTVGNNVGTPAFIQIANGGTVTVAAQGILGSGGFTNVGANSTGGTLRVSSNGSVFPGRFSTGGDLRVGVNSGFGTVVQNDGTVTVAGTLRIGDSNDSTSAFTGAGTYTHNGGVLTAGFIRIASGPSNPQRRLDGTFNLTGSAVATTSGLEVGLHNQPGLAVVNQSGGQLTVNGLTFIGQSSNGIFNLNGGRFTGNGQTIVYSGGTFNYNGGSFSAGTLSLFESSRMLLSGGANKLVQVGTLEMRSQSALDLNDNAMIVYNRASSVESLIAVGYAGGAWNGAGIRSTAAAGNASSPNKTALGYAQAGALGISSFFGQPVAPDDLLIRHTLAGDANLDGAVDLTDFARLAPHFNGAFQGWSRGDFNFDFSIGLGDFSLLAANFNRSIAGAPAASASPGAAAAVPEPTTSILILAVTSRVASRRRRRRCAN